MKERYSTYVPVVPPASTGDQETEGRLLEIGAQPYGFGEDLTDLNPAPDQQSAQATDDQAIRKQWDRVAAPLRQAGLYASGCTAAAAVRKLGLKKPMFAVYQVLHRQAAVETLRLHLAAAKAPSDWQTHAGNIEGRSAELALALALLLAASQAPPRLVIATGCLGAQPAGTRLEHPDVEVLSVGKVPEKLRLVEQLAKTQRLPRGREHTDPVWLFTPATFENGGEPVAVDTLPEVARLKALGITVVPVNTLMEAAEKLGAQRARWMGQDSVWLGGIVGLPLMVGAVLYAVLYGPKPPLPVTPPQLDITVVEPASETEEPLQSARTVFLDETLRLRFSRHPGEFRYLLQVHPDGDAYLDPLPPQADAQDMDIRTVLPPAFPQNPADLTVLLLVTPEAWSKRQQDALARALKTLHPQLELPTGVQYQFTMGQCTPVTVGPKLTQLTFKGPPATFKPPPESAVCADGARQLLETLHQQTQGTVRWSGYTFKVARD